MKRALCLAVILLLAGPVAFAAAGLQVNGQKNHVTVTETTVYGDPETAAGVQVRITSQWEGHLIWDTVHTVGSGVTESSFRFSSMGEIWEKKVTDTVDIYIPVNWGMVYTNGPSRSGFDPDALRLSEVLRSVMEHTKPGERRTETVNLKDFYDYYPMEVRFNSKAQNVSYYSESDDDFTDLLQVPMGEATVEITMEKDRNGEVIDFQCQSLDTPFFISCAVYGREGCYHTFYMEGRRNGEVEDPGPNYGIYYYPYVESKDNRSGFTVDPGRAGLLYRLQPGIYTVEMAVNEPLGELYLVTKEEQEFYLSVFDTQGDSLSLKQKLAVRSVAGEPGEEDNPYWLQLSVQDNGVMMIWRDGSFVFVARQGEEFQSWGLERYPAAPDTDLTFPTENVWAFDGHRLAVASFVDWGSLSVGLTVYTEEGLAWYGVCEHSGDIFKQQSSSLLRLMPPATFKTSSDIITDRMYRNGVDVKELLGIEWVNEE